jgi:hypothetical protein
MENYNQLKTNSISKSFVFASLFISGFQAQTVLENCFTNTECETTLGEGACCLYEQDLNTDSQ